MNIVKKVLTVKTGAVSAFQLFSVSVFAKIVAGAALAFQLFSVSAFAQVTPITLQYALSNTWAISNCVYTLATNANPITLYQGKGLALSANFTADPLWTTGVIGMGFAFSVDGTNYSTDTNRLVWHWFQPNGSINVRSFTNWSPNLVDNARFAKLLLITNANNATCQIAWLTNVIIGVKQ